MVAVLVAHRRRRQEHRGAASFGILHTGLEVVLETLLLEGDRAVLALERHRVVDDLLVLLQAANVILQLTLLVLHLYVLLRQIVVHLQQRLVFLLQLEELWRVHYRDH